MKAYEKRCKAKFARLSALNTLPVGEGNKVKYKMAETWQHRGINLGWARSEKTARAVSKGLV